MTRVLREEKNDLHGILWNELQVVLNASYDLVFNSIFSSIRTLEIQRQRLSRLSDACARLSVGNPNLTNLEPDYNEIYVDDDRQYVYYLVSKL